MKINFHEGCDNSYCKQCMDNATALSNAIYDGIGNNRHDWDGAYHSHLMKLGINPETDCGWWSEAAFNDANLLPFIEARKGE